MTNLNPVVAAAQQQQLRPKLDALLTALDGDTDIQALTFFTTALLSLQQATDPADIGELFVQLSTTAFLGFEFSAHQAILVDDLLAEAEQIAHALSADNEQPH